MRYLVFFLEEPSAKEMLEGLLPRILNPDIDVKYIIFEGKQDLEKRIEKKLLHWQLPNSYFLVLRDKDSGDCHIIKNELLTKINKTSKQDVSLVRIACHELESFYLGDLKAVENALEINGLSTHQEKRKYRNPDKLGSPSEELKKITMRKYQKKSGSRAIGRFLSITGSNRSHSFNILIQGIYKLVDMA